MQTIEENIERFIKAVNVGEEVKRCLEHESKRQQILSVYQALCLKQAQVGFLTSDEQWLFSAINDCAKEWVKENAEMNNHLLKEIQKEIIEQLSKRL